MTIGASAPENRRPRNLQVALGITKSRTHPRDVTGISVDTGPTIWAKRIELLYEIFPAMWQLTFLVPHTIL